MELSVLDGGRDELLLGLELLIDRLLVLLSLLYVRELL